jgi:hypothetical protein
MKILWLQALGQKGQAQDRFSQSKAHTARLVHMPALPRSNSSLLVRTDFTDDDASQQVSDDALRENQDGFRAYLELVSDHAFAEARWEEVKAAVPAECREALVLFVADSTDWYTSRSA